LPPYSPDLNPIEEGFAELKAWCKKHHTEVQRMEFEEFLEHALENVNDVARGHFKSSQIGLPLRQGSEEDYWDD
jgi:DDE superfamily endonuclease